MSTGKRVAVAAAVALALTAVLAGWRALRRTDPPGAGSIARLAIAFGDVSLRRAGSFTFRKAAAGAELGSGDSVKTGSASRAVIVYAGGSRFHVDPASLLVVVPQDDARIRSLVL